jgi:cell wall-associated NlpC family hydrolase
MRFCVRMSLKALKALLLSAVVFTVFSSWPSLVAAAPVAPIPLSPGSPMPGLTVNTLTPTFYWQGVSGADYYRFSMSEYPYGTEHIVYTSPNIYGTSFTLPSGVLTDAKQYRWNMRAWNSTGSSDFSNTLYFETRLPAQPPPPPTQQLPGVPAPVSPGSGSSPGPAVATLTPTFSWQAAPRAEYYRFSVSRYPYGASNIIYTSPNVTGTSFVLPGGALSEDGKYCWDMRAWNSAGASDFSSALYFQTSPPAQPPGTPVLLSVTPKMKGATPGLFLEWSPVSGATGYYVYRDGMKIAPAAAGSTTFWNYGSLTEGVMYTYQVTAASGSVEGQKSNSITQTAPRLTMVKAPTLLSVTTKTEGGTSSLLLEWTQIPEATGYRIYRDQVEIAEVGPEQTTFVDSSGLAPGVSYSYQLSAVIGSVESQRCGAITVTFPKPVSGDETGSRLAQAAVEMAKVLNGDPSSRAPYLLEAKGRHWDYLLGHSAGKARWASPEEIKSTGYQWKIMLVNGKSVEIKEPGLDCSGLIMWAYNYAYDRNGAYWDLSNPIYKEGAGDQWRDTARVEQLRPVVGRDAEVPLKELGEAYKQGGAAGLGLRQGDVLYFLQPLGRPIGKDWFNHAVLYIGGGNVLHSEYKIGVHTESLEKMLRRFVDKQEEYGFATVGIARIRMTEVRAPGSQAAGVSLPVRKATFSDTSSHLWAQGAIDSLATQGIVNGVGENRFAPEAAVTRAQFAAFLQRTFDLPELTAPLPFADVPLDSWAHSVIQAARQYMEYYGTSSGLAAFFPDVEVTREESAAAIVRILSARGKMRVVDAGTSTSILSGFKDAAMVRSANRTYVATAVQERILRGQSDDTLNPGGNLTRAEAAVLLDRVQVSFLMSSLCTSGTSTAESATRTFMCSLLPYAAKASEATGFPVTFVLGHWALESDWGRSEVACDNNNFAGIEATGRHPAGAQHTRWAVFQSLDDFTQGYVETIMLDYYVGARKAAREGQPAAVVGELLHEEGYCPDDHRYGDKIAGRVSEVKAYLPD